MGWLMFANPGDKWKPDPDYAMGEDWQPKKEYVDGVREEIKSEFENAKKSSLVSKQYPIKGACDLYPMPALLENLDNFKRSYIYICEAEGGILSNGEVEKGTLYYVNLKGKQEVVFNGNDQCKQFYDDITYRLYVSDDCVENE